MKTDTVDAPSFKTRYLRDRKNNERVLTLVTSVKDNVLSYAIAVNSPPGVRHDTIDITDEADKTEGKGLLVTDRSGDRFCRKKGSSIAYGRLNNDRTKKVINFDPATQHPLIVALTSISVDPMAPSSASRIASQELSAIHGRGGLSKVSKGGGLSKSPEVMGQLNAAFSALTKLADHMADQKATEAVADV